MSARRRSISRTQRLPTSTLWHPDVGTAADARRGAGLLRRSISRASVGRRPRRCGPGWCRCAGSPGCARRFSWRAGGSRRARPRDPPNPAQWSDAGLEPRDEGAYRCAHRSMLRARDHSVDPVRMDGLTRSCFVLRVVPSCGRPSLPTIPTTRSPSPSTTAAARCRTRRAASTTRGRSARPTAGTPKPLDPWTTTSCRRCARR